MDERAAAGPYQLGLASNGGEIRQLPFSIPRR